MIWDYIGKTLLAGTEIVSNSFTNLVVSQDTFISGEWDMIPVVQDTAGGRIKVNPIPASSIRSVTSEPAVSQNIEGKGVLASVVYTGGSAELWHEGQVIATSPSEVGTKISYTEEAGFLVPKEATILEQEATQQQDGLAIGLPVGLAAIALLYLLFKK